MDDGTIRRFEIANRYLSNQTSQTWDRLACEVMNESRRNVTDDIESEAIGLLRASYWDSVRLYADEIAEAIRDQFAADNPGETFDYGDILGTAWEDMLSRLADERADGSQWVIYTWRARLVRSLSDNGDDMDKETSSSLDESLSFAAYYSLRADIEETTRRLLRDA